MHCLHEQTSRVKPEFCKDQYTFRWLFAYCFRFHAKAPPWPVGPESTFSAPSTMSSSGAIIGKCFIKMSRLTEAATYRGRDPSTLSLAVKQLEAQIHCETRLRQRMQGIAARLRLGGRHINRQKPGTISSSVAVHHLSFVLLIEHIM